MEQNKRGKYVLRSTYQKKCEENKRLLADIKLLTSDGFSADRILLREKWNKKFKQDAAFNQMLQAACLEYIEENPQYKIENIIKAKNAKP